VRTIMHRVPAVQHVPQNRVPDMEADAPHHGFVGPEKATERAVAVKAWIERQHRCSSWCYEKHLNAQCLQAHQSSSFNSDVRGNYKLFRSQFLKGRIRLALSAIAVALFTDRSAVAFGFKVESLNVTAGKLRYPKEAHRPGSSW